MKQLKHICEGLLKGQEETVSNGENDINASLGIPTINDFKWNSLGCSVFFPCADRLKKYNGYGRCPRRSSGLQFSIVKLSSFSCYIVVKFCEQDERAASYYASEIKGWNSNYYSGKSVNYLKKVVISLIEHLAKNPKAFDAMLDYNVETYKDISCRQSYDDGRPWKWKGFEELFKIKG